MMQWTQSDVARRFISLIPPKPSVGRASVALYSSIFGEEIGQKAWQLCLQRKTKYPRCKNGPFMELLPSGMANFGPTSRKSGGITLSSIAGYRVEWLQHVIRKHEEGKYWTLINLNGKKNTIDRRKTNYFPSTYSFYYYPWIFNL